MLHSTTAYSKTVAIRPGESTLLLAAGLAGIAIVESGYLWSRRKRWSAEQKYANGRQEETSELLLAEGDQCHQGSFATFQRSTESTSHQQTLSSGLLARQPLLSSPLPHLSQDWHRHCH